ncbi:MAG: PqqD family protein [Nitrososphaerales archaeon]
MNENGEAIKVNEPIVVLWNMCNGISFSELVDTVADTSQQDAVSVRNSLENLFAELRQYNLLEIKES